MGWDGYGYLDGLGKIEEFELALLFALVYGLLLIRSFYCGIMLWNCAAASITFFTIV